MKIAIGADHAGFTLKEQLRRRLEQQGHEVVDVGTAGEASADYPDYAEKVANQLVAGAVERGLLVCSTGVGMSIAANKVAGIRAALAVNPEEVALVRSHNNANVLTLGARYLGEEEAGKLVGIFLDTPFEGGRHARRIEKIAAIERKNQQRGE